MKIPDSIGGLAARCRCIGSRPKARYGSIPRAGCPVSFVTGKRSMAQAIRRSPPLGEHLSLHVSQRVREGLLIGFGGVALFVLVALITFHIEDPGWSHTGTGGGHDIRNAGGASGAWLADVLRYLLGQFAYLFPVMVAYTGWLLYQRPPDTGPLDYPKLTVRAVGFMLTCCAGCALV